jgi:hypothetical protein
MKPYCTQNDGDCNTCSLVNYGRDCRNRPVKQHTVNFTVNFSSRLPYGLAVWLDVYCSQTRIIKAALLAAAVEMYRKTTKGEEQNA